MILFGDGDALTGGGIVGGAVALATALYFIYDKFKTRQETSADKRVALRTAEITVEALASKKVAEAYDAFAAERKAAHESDVAFLKGEIADNKKRLAELEQRAEEARKREQECQETCRELRDQNTDQAGEMRDLRLKIDGLEKRLKEAGSLPQGSGPHPPLKDGS